MERLNHPIPRQRESSDLATLRAEHGARWHILHTSDAWHAVRRDPRPALQGLSAHTARSLLADLARVEESTR